MLRTAIDPAQALEERRQEERLRKLTSVVPVNSAELLCDGTRYVNFTSNDYLGLSQHPSLKERAIEFIQRYGVGSSASRLLSGNIEVYDSIERQLAALKGSQSALVFSSGYQLNLTVLSVLANFGGSFLCDRLIHNSLLTGAMTSKAAFHRLKHNDKADLKRMLAEPEGEKASGWIVTESVFGMDGDLADLSGYADLIRNTDFKLFIDEAHATGVFGETGMGLADANSDRQLVMGTFGKGCGSFGAYIACSFEMRDYLVNFCPGFIYTTALPPPVLGAIEAALQIIPTMKKEREYLLSLAEHTRTLLRSIGLDVGTSASQIIPIIVGTDAKALSLSQHLMQNQIYVPAIRPPTVPPKTARLRLAISALHNEAHIERLITALKKWRPIH